MRRRSPAPSPRSPRFPIAARPLAGQGASARSPISLPPSPHDATSTSTAPRLAARPSRSYWRAAGWVLAAVVVVLVGRVLLHDLRELRAHPLTISPSWATIALSGAVFLLAHSVLVQTWRSVLG